MDGDEKVRRLLALKDRYVERLKRVEEVLGEVERITNRLDRLREEQKELQHALEADGAELESLK